MPEVAREARESTTEGGATAFVRMEFISGEDGIDSPAEFLLSKSAFKIPRTKIDDNP